MNLFALVDDPTNRVRKFSLTEELQVDLGCFFTSLEHRFSAPIEETIPFDGKYKPDDGEILEISGFTDIDGLSDAVRNPMLVQDYIPSDEILLNTIALFTGRVEADSEVTVLIQKFEKNRILSTSGFSIFFANHTYRKVEGTGLTIDTKLCGILKGTSLKFKSFFLMRQIFDISDYYKEATDQDLRTFAQTNQISIPDVERFVSEADTWTRRKITIVEASGILRNIPLSQIQTVADEFPIQCELVVVDGKLVLPTSKKELKNLLRFLCEDYFKSPLSNGFYLTNSKRTV